MVSCFVVLKAFLNIATTSMTSLRSSQNLVEQRAYIISCVWSAVDVFIFPKQQFPQAVPGDAAAQLRLGEADRLDLSISDSKELFD